jgi:hypothetical protein
LSDDKNKISNHSDILDSLERESRGDGLDATDDKPLDFIILAGRTPVTACQIAKEADTSKGAITGVVDSLEKRATLSATQSSFKAD